jgi:pimeloyl-ACP methyl ester carboxylesterase
VTDAAAAGPAAVRSERMTVNGISMHLRTAGDGPLVVLLHGWPETSYAWRRVVPELAAQYTTVAVDMRGCGDSDRPEGGYDKRTVAADVAALIDQLGLGQARVAGHDWGGAVGYYLTAAYPGLVSHFAAIETVLPGFGLADLADISLGQQHAWWMSLATMLDVPEWLLAGREREFLAYFYRQHAYSPGAIGPADLDEYARCYCAPGPCEPDSVTTGPWLTTSGISATCQFPAVPFCPSAAGSGSAAWSPRASARSRRIQRR